MPALNSGWGIGGVGGLAALALALGAPAVAQPTAVLPIPPPAPAAEAAASVQIPPLTRAQVKTALQVLRDAAAQGLRPQAYAPTDVAAEGDLDSGQQAALVKAVERYAHDVHVGRLSPGDFPEDWALRPAPYDPAPGLAKALADDRLAEWLASLPPPYAGYDGLKRGLARYRQIAAAGGWPTVPEGAPLTLGDKGARVAALRARLAVEDPQVAAGGSSVFDEALQAAVQRAQVRFGLRPDGVAGGSTLTALNQPVGQRILQIIANMERWRWLPPTMPPTRVQVNSGAAIVTLFQDDRPVLSMKAVSGKPDDETPMLASAIRSIVINPPWNVPQSIADKELWPKERAHPGYLASHDYRIIKTDDGQRLQQASGDESALGRFKFDFDNPFAVYLHDTPARSGFDRVTRQASHGCVRLEKAQTLAETLLQADPAWTPQAIAAQLQTDKTVRVPLAQPVPVFILYWTAFEGPQGQMHFRDDPYGWDRQLLQLVGVLSSGTKA